MNAQLAKPIAILNGSLLIALYFIFWIVVTVVLPILSLGLRLYTKEQGILKDHTQEPKLEIKPSGELSGQNYGF